MRRLIIFCCLSILVASCSGSKNGEIGLNSDENFSNGRILKFDSLTMEFKAIREAGEADTNRLNKLNRGISAYLKENPNEPDLILFRMWLNTTSYETEKIRADGKKLLTLTNEEFHIKNYYGIVIESYVIDGDTSSYCNTISEANANGFEFKDEFGICDNN